MKIDIYETVVRKATIEVDAKSEKAGHNKAQELYETNGASFPWEIWSTEGVAMSVHTDWNTRSKGSK